MKDDFLNNFPYCLPEAVLETVTDERGNIVRQVPDQLIVFIVNYFIDKENWDYEIYNVWQDDFQIHMEGSVTISGIFTTIAKASININRYCSGPLKGQLVDQNQDMLQLQNKLVKKCFRQMGIGRRAMTEEGTFIEIPQMLWPVEKTSPPASGPEAEAVRDRIKYLRSIAGLGVKKDHLFLDYCEKITGSVPDLMSMEQLLAVSDGLEKKFSQMDELY